MFQQAKQKTLRRRGIQLPEDTGSFPIISPNTILTPDTGNILFTQSTLIEIANIIGNRFLHRKLTGSEVSFLRNYVNSISTSMYKGLSFEQAKLQIAQTVFSAMSNPESAGISRRREMDLHDWQKQTVFQMTDDEHPYKYSAFNQEESDLKVQETTNKDLETPGYALSGYATIEQKKNNITDMVGATLALVDTVARLENAVRTYNDPAKINNIIRASHSIRITTEDISLKHVYIPFDSRYRLVPSSLSFPTPFDNATLKDILIPATLSFNVHSAMSTNIYGNIRIAQEIKEIIEMSITDIYLPAYSDIDFFYDRVTLFIEEMQEQSAIMADGISFHFMFKAEKIVNTGCPTESRIKLTPIAPYDKFRFRYPIAKLINTTFIFRNPYQIINYQSDIVVCNIAAGSPAIFTTVNLNDHTLLSGQLIYVQGVTSGYPSQNSAFNRPEGHVVTVTAANTFIVTTAGATPNDITLELQNPASSILCFIGCRRFMIPMRFKMLE